MHIKTSLWDLWYLSTSSVPKISTFGILCLYGHQETFGELPSSSYAQTDWITKSAISPSARIIMLMYHCLVMAIYSIKEKKKKQLPTTPMQCISLANQKVINLLPDCHIKVYECIVYWYSKYRSVLKSLPVNYWAQRALAPRS